LTSEYCATVPDPTFAKGVDKPSSTSIPRERKRQAREKHRVTAIHIQHVCRSAYPAAEVHNSGRHLNFANNASARRRNVEIRTTSWAYCWQSGLRAKFEPINQLNRSRQRARFGGSRAETPFPRVRAEPPSMKA